MQFKENEMKTNLEKAGIMSTIVEYWSVVFYLAANSLRELHGEQASTGFITRSCAAPRGAVWLFFVNHEHQSHVGRADVRAMIHVTRGESQEETASRTSLEEGTKLEGKQYECIHATVVGDGSVGLVTLDRPKAPNALSNARLMVEVRCDALQAFDAFPKIGAIVITGKGKGLLPGAAVTRIRKPNIAAVNG